MSLLEVMFMVQRVIQGSEALAKQIKARKNELGLTIEEAASRAGVGMKTWYRYEIGESIRKDKCKGICKALNWYSLPEQEEASDTLSISKFKKHEAWSRFLEHNFGSMAALSFAAGSDILYDHIKEDMGELSSLPAGAHLGQLSVSWRKDTLPQQFLMHYDYEFLYRMKCTLNQMRMRAKHDLPMTAHSVIEELLIYLCNEEATAFVDLSDGIYGLEDDNVSDPDEWVFDLFDDMDIITCLYSDMYLDANHSYHFSHWMDQQFYTN